MCEKINKSTEMEKIYLPRGGVVFVEYQKKSKPVIKAYCGG